MLLLPAGFVGLWFSSLPRRTRVSPPPTPPHHSGFRLARIYKTSEADVVFLRHRKVCAGGGLPVRDRKAWQA
eukprot:79218-Pyramimonas_sp.AAC.1